MRSEKQNQTVLGNSVTRSENRSIQVIQSRSQRQINIFCRFEEGKLTKNEKDEIYLPFRTYFPESYLMAEIKNPKAGTQIITILALTT